MRIAVSDDEMRCSPKPIKGNGMDISTAAKATSQRRGSPRSAPVRTLFVVFSVLNMVTGLAGATFHLVFNFEGDVSWTAQGLKDAFEGTRPVLAAAAFAHIGFTGLLCSLLPALDPAGLSAADSAHPLSDLDTQK